MNARRAGQPRASLRARERHVSIPLLASLAVVMAVGLMGVLTVHAVAARRSCTRHPVLVRVAASADIAPALTRIGRAFNQRHAMVGGRCVSVSVRAQSPAAVAASVDGQAGAQGDAVGGAAGAAGAAGGAAVDAWVPDSSLWLDVVRGFPLGAQRVQPTGITVARSPVMIVMPASVAAATPAFNSTTSWHFLLPASVGGPASALHLRVDLPDPTQSSAGLATMVEMSRLLGGGPAGRAALTKFVFSIEPTPQFDSAASLAAFVALAQPPLDGHPVTVASEQAVVQYDQASPGQPLAARYPAGTSAALGSPELDYPYLVTSSDRLEASAALQFGQALRQRYATQVVRYYGFRSADNVSAALPSGSGLAGQLLRLAPPVTPSEAQTVLQAWQRLGLGSRDLTLVDVSAAMSKPAGQSGMTLEQVLAKTAGLGLALFPDSTHMGLWEYASNLPGDRPYRQVVPIGPLPGEIGLISRRQQIQQATAELRPVPGAAAALDDSILAGYKHMLASYQPKYSNAVLVLTSGVDNAPGDMPPAELVRKLRALYNPARRVEIVIIMFGDAGKFSDMQQIAAATGGAAYEITNPAQIGKVFFSAIARRICPSNCTAP